MLNSKKSKKEDHWISLSDLMTSLMMIFLLISIIFMLKVQNDKRELIEFQKKTKKINEVFKDISIDDIRSSVSIPIVYANTIKDLRQELFSEFKNDLEYWHANIDEDLTVQFNAPNIMFETNSSELKPRFKEILSDFFPRYFKIIQNKKYKNEIEEIRIEGHTSSIWNNAINDQDAYVNNMILSQDRAIKTLEYLIKLDVISENNLSFQWFKNHIRAVGFSSSKPRDDKGTLTSLSYRPENLSRSQRVEFRVKTTVETKISELIENKK